jgi:photosystem I subunit XI
MPNQAVTNAGDSQISNLATPVNSAGIVKAFISGLPAYRQGLSAGRRGLEVGMAHGYLLVGPFTLLGPQRNTANAHVAGLLASIGLVVILTACLSLYASVKPGPPLASVAVPKIPTELSTQNGWNEFTGMFLLGGAGGAVFAWLLLSNIPMLNSLAPF